MQCSLRTQRTVSTLGNGEIHIWLCYRDRGALCRGLLLLRFRVRAGSHRLRANATGNETSAFISERQNRSGSAQKRGVPCERYRPAERGKSISPALQRVSWPAGRSEIGHPKGHVSGPSATAARHRSDGRSTGRVVLESEKRDTSDRNARVRGRSVRKGSVEHQRTVGRR